MKRLAIFLIILCLLSACSWVEPSQLSSDSIQDTDYEAEPSLSSSDSNQATDYEIEPSRLAKGSKQGTYYEIFVRSFADGNGDGIGDFKGLTSKLDYIKSMGFTGIWLMPCFASPSYHGYDITDYYSINPDYGTMEDFDEFLAEAKQLDIAVILDLVINHTSSQSEWFNASLDPESPYRNWYQWSDGTDVNLNASFNGNKVWNAYGDYYYAGLFWDQMPDLNLDNPDVRAEMKNIAKFWLDKGVSGFRLDAAMHVYNVCELPVGAPSATDSNLKWWSEFADYCREVDPNCYLVGEVWDAPTTRTPYAAALDSVFHFNMGEMLARIITEGKCTNNVFPDSMRIEYDRLAEADPNAINAIFLSNHDQTRISTALRNDPQNLKLAASVYLTIQGLPFVYYGEELGMIGGKPDENIRTPFLWGEDDPTLTTWYNSVYNAKVADFTKQVTDDDSLLNHYGKLIRLRAAMPALFAGILEPVDPKNNALMAYTMTAYDETGGITQRALIVHNLSSEPQTTELSGEGNLKFATVTEGLIMDNSSVTLPPKCSVIIEKQHD